MQVHMTIADFRLQIADLRLIAHERVEALFPLSYTFPSYALSAIVH
jgi:hypothetical protein